MVRSPARLFARDALSDIGPLDDLEPIPSVSNGLVRDGFQGVQLEVQEAVFPEFVLGKLRDPADRFGHLPTIHSITNLGKEDCTRDVDHPRRLEWAVAASFGGDFLEVGEPTFETEQGVHHEEACLVELNFDRKFLNFFSVWPNNGPEEIHHQQAFPSSQECEGRARGRVRISSELKINIRRPTKTVAEPFRIELVTKPVSISCEGLMLP